MDRQYQLFETPEYTYRVFVTNMDGLLLFNREDSESVESLRHTTLATSRKERPGSRRSCRPRSAADHRRA